LQKLQTLLDALQAASSSISVDTLTVADINGSLAGASPHMGSTAALVGACIGMCPPVYVHDHNLWQVECPVGAGAGGFMLHSHASMNTALGSCLGASSEPQVYVSMI